MKSGEIKAPGKKKSLEKLSHLDHFNAKHIADFQKHAKHLHFT